RTIHRRITLNGAIGYGGLAGARGDLEIEAGQTAAVALCGIAILQNYVGQTEVRRAGGAGVELHAATVTVNTVPAAVVPIFQDQVGNRRARAGDRTVRRSQVFVDVHHHVNAVGCALVISGSPGLDNGCGITGAVNRANDRNRVLY